MRLTPVRCKKCHKLLGRINGVVEIVCPRCKAMNLIESVSSDDTLDNPNEKQPSLKA